MHYAPKNINFLHSNHTHYETDIRTQELAGERARDRVGLLKQIEGTNIRMTNMKNEMKEIEIALKLTDREIELLRNSTSDLGLEDKDCLSLQMKIANAILDGNIVRFHGEHCSSRKAN